MTDSTFRPRWTPAPHPDHPDWLSWELRDGGRFNGVLGTMLVRQVGERAQVRMFPEQHHSNLQDILHGGVTLSFIDIALFAAARVLGALDDAAVTLDLSTQFIGAGAIGVPLDAEIELLRSTRRLVFLRGLVRQDEATVAGFSGTLRKLR